MYGYACINQSLRTNPTPVLTSRTVRIRNRTPETLLNLSELNLIDLIKILEWNIKNNILFYRISSDVIPYQDISILNSKRLDALFSEIEKYSKKIRLTFHPGPYNKLASPHDNIVQTTRDELEFHGAFMDRINASMTHYNKINIHMGGAYDDKPQTVKRFIANFNLLSNSVKSRLTLENDDRLSLFNTSELYNMVYQVTGIPIVFDIHHHKLTVGQDYKDYLKLAVSTWHGIKPVVHYSESEPGAKNLIWHSKYITTKKINVYNYDVDVMIEAKEKELALLKYLENNGTI